MLVNRPVAIVIGAVADLVGRLSSFASLDDLARDTGRFAPNRAGTLAAGDGGRRPVFVDRTIAVIVDAIAGGVPRWPDPRHAIIDDRTARTHSATGRRALSYPADGLVGLEVLVRGAVAVLVDAVADIDGAGVNPGIAVVAVVARSRLCEMTIAVGVQVADGGAERIGGVETELDLEPILPAVTIGVAGDRHRPEGRVSARGISERHVKDCAHPSSARRDAPVCIDAGHRGISRGPGVGR